MTKPLADRLVEAASAIEELNAMQGLPAERAAVSPKYLREEAARMAPRTVAEQLDAAQTGEEFGQVLQGLFSTLEQQRDETEETS